MKFHLYDHSCYHISAFVIAVLLLDFILLWITVFTDFLGISMAFACKFIYFLVLGFLLKLGLVISHGNVKAQFVVQIHKYPKDMVFSRSNVFCYSDHL